MSQVITDAFASYWQQCLVDQTPVELDEFVLAHIPGLDPEAPIDPASGLPLPEQIVHRHPVDQRGRINNDAVAYSIVMDTRVGDFTFNAMYLINSAQNLVGMIVHKGEETKLRTDPAIGQTGNSLVKSMLMEYDRAAEASQTVIDASTWQIDYAARLRGMDEDLRRQAMGTFGQAAFYGDGFKLVNDAGRYKVQPGQGYVGGLLVELATEKEVIPSAKPVGLWLDVYRAGSLLSSWVNYIVLTLSTTDLVDYVDASGYPHFVTKLATINSDDSVTDTRTRRTLTLTGDVTGQATFNGPDSIQLVAHVEDNSHGHTIENVAGLQEALDSKAESEHQHDIGDVLWLQEELDEKAEVGHTHTPDEAGAAPLEHGHELADVAGLPAALGEKYPNTGGPIGDFWRGDAAKRYGAVLVLGQAGDGKASLVILAKKYVGTALSKTGFIGRIIYDQGNTSGNLQSDFVDLAVSSAYQQNSASMLFRSGETVSAAKIVEVTYNGEIHYALYRQVMSGAAVVAVGHAFTADLPALVPDATAYAMTDVATTERIYHWSNKPTAADVGLKTFWGQASNGVTLPIPAGYSAANTGFIASGFYLEQDGDDWHGADIRINPSTRVTTCRGDGNYTAPWMYYHVIAGPAITGGTTRDSIPDEIEFAPDGQQYYICNQEGVCQVTTNYLPDAADLQLRAEVAMLGPAGIAVTDARLVDGHIAAITPDEATLRNAPHRRTKALSHAMTQASHWDMMSDPTQAAAWRTYYQQLYALEQAPDWPLVEQWPTAPELAA